MTTPVPRAISLHRALLGTIVLALVGGVVPAALVLDRRLAGVLESRARTDLAMTPRLVADRAASSSDAMMMHAKDFAHVSALSVALAAGDREAVQRLTDAARSALGGDPVVIGPNGGVWIGTTSASLLEPLAARTRAGEMPVATVREGVQLHDVALAPVEYGGRWVGAVGVSSPLDDEHAAALAGLTRTDVILVDTAPVAGVGMTSAAGLSSPSAMVSTLDPVVTAALVKGWRAASGIVSAADSVRDVRVGGAHLLVIAVRQRDAGVVLLVRNLDEELAVLPELRRIALVSALAALLAALVVGVLLATRIARPVTAVARAADALARGDFDAPLTLATRSTFIVREVARVETAFSSMRDTLADRLRALAAANDALADRNARLTALQSDLVQRERLAATGRLVVQLAHEIRNPVASLRNCLELIRRRVAHDEEAREFADLAVDELLRMHELAEQMLDLNRPRASRDTAGETANVCDAARVMQQMVALLTAGTAEHPPTVRGDSGESSCAHAASTTVTIDADVLKQVLHNLVQNAREAMDGQRDGVVRLDLEREHEHLVIAVRDNGPGIAADVLPRIFDPFFTTKREMRGVGLGLFIAEGLVRAAGGQLEVTSQTEATRSAPRGTTFRVRLPLQAAPAMATA
ncbi:sensor histidine kinase [Gemmatimonas groenlandica]|uniref:histidine kinase n=1 Tax=Gemmatimonas groenlandica TaxID=2732249 RepID=A0A6M4IRY3_9BACT|nr:ATP-binding protein [Gemmatimonas groenlandica]QJR36895.1 hypothetical protein HKW67_15930 [Gemmatimonas groenlandica]